MPKARFLLAVFSLLLALAASAGRVSAAESGFSIYPLGSLSFDAGVPPPPGFYATTAVGYYHGAFRTQNLIGGVPTIGLDVKFVAPALNLLYVPTAEVLGGRFGVSVTAPVGCVDFSAQLVLANLNAAREVSGCGYGDMSARVQLGWTLGDFSHTIYVTGFAPTGRYDTGFVPDIGLNRPAADHRRQRGRRDARAQQGSDERHRSGR